MRADPDGHRLLADIEMQEARRLAAAAKAGEQMLPERHVQALLAQAQAAALHL